MKNYLLPLFALLFVSCGNHSQRQSYDEVLNEIVQNSNSGTIGGDSINAFLKKYPTYDALLNDDRFMTGTVMKEDIMLALISDYIDAGQFDNAQRLYDDMLKYAESEYGKISQLVAMTYCEKAHLYERVGDLDNAVKMMQKSAMVFMKLPKSDMNLYEDAREFIGRWMEKREEKANNLIFIIRENSQQPFPVDSLITNMNSILTCEKAAYSNARIPKISTRSFYVLDKDLFMEFIKDTMDYNFILSKYNEAYDGEGWMNYELLSRRLAMKIVDKYYQRALITAKKENADSYLRTAHRAWLKSVQQDSSFFNTTLYNDRVYGLEYYNNYVQYQAIEIINKAIFYYNYLNLFSKNDEI